MHIKWNHQLFLDLLAPAVLLGIWRAWSWTTAPRLGVYFTAEALLIAYAYFAVVRGVHADARSYDRAGHYCRGLALKAGDGFFLELRRSWAKIAVVFLSLLLAAFILDVLTANTGIQRRPNVHLSILFIEIMVWARYGAAIVIAAARWSPPAPPAFAEARTLASGFPVAASFASVNVAFGIAAACVIAAYKWAGTLLPSAEAELVCMALVFAGLAWLALWLHCRWSAYALTRLEACHVVMPAERVRARAGIQARQ